jgi:hypothetical protein
VFQLRSSPVEGDDESDNCHIEDMELAELWVLADKIAVPALQNRVISKIIAVREKTKVAPIRTLCYIYQRTATDSQLRRLMVSEVANFQPGWSFSSPKVAQLLPHAFLVEMAQYTMARLRKDNKYKAKASEFFVPLPGEEKAPGGS